MRISLTVKAGPHAGRRFEFQEHDNFIVGRSARAHFALPVKDKSISRIHFMIEMNPPQCRLIDMDSTNGTKVNGQKVTTADLKDGDLITAGLTVLLVTVTGSDELPASPGPLPPAGAAAGDGALRPGPQASRIASPPGAGARPSTEDHPPPRPSVKGPRCCRVCGGPLAGGGAGSSGEHPTSHAIPLCPACRDRIRAHPQPIPGYHVVGVLGRGTLGVVYLALRTVDGTRVALKTIQPAVVPARRDIEHFLREARGLSALDHPNIVAFHEMGETNGLLHVATDYVPGVDVARLQEQQGGALPIARAVDLVCQLLRALDYAHARGFVHRDIKPANILVTPQGGRTLVRLTDFGLARVYQASKMSGLTMNADLGGSAAFRAPEQITELRNAHPAVDQYGAGATLYMLLTGRPIYDLPDRLEQQVMKILLGGPRPDPRATPGPAGGAGRGHPSRAGEGPAGPVRRREGDAPGARPLRDVIEGTGTQPPTADATRPPIRYHGARPSFLALPDRREGMTMSTQTTGQTAQEEIEYPETDGEPMAENTLQYEWITTIKGGLDIVFRDDPDVFVAGDLFWYPVQGDNTTRRAPDVMVALGRPKGHRRSYLQWREGGIAPQVVFEILSPSNRGEELGLKFQFYQTYGVEEYYIYDPDFHTLEGWLREEGTLRKIPEMNGWISPRLGVRFELVDDQFRLYGPDGQPFITMLEYALEAEEQRRQAEEQRRQAEEQRQRAERLAAQLRALGVEPEP